MAAQAPLGPAAAMPLVPASAPVAKLSDYYADDSNDPTGGDPSSLLTPFEHDLHNNANNVSTNDVKAGLAQSGENNHMIAVAITSGGKMQLYMNVRFSVRVVESLDPFVCAVCVRPQRPPDPRSVPETGSII